MQLAWSPILPLRHPALALLSLTTSSLAQTWARTGTGGCRPGCGSRGRGDLGAGHAAGSPGLAGLCVRGA